MRYCQVNITIYYSTTTDHLGSICQLIEADGTVGEQTNYDPWGRIRNLHSWQYDQSARLNLIPRGYTGHEMLREFGLINMNGRVYDPLTSRFLSPDNYIQSPNNPQNYNRYTYALNNPLKYVDPDGEFFLTWNITKTGLSIGVNFTPEGVPLGFGINVDWSDGLTLGVYGEIGVRYGGTGMGAGATLNFGINYNFKHQNWVATASEGGYYSFGLFTVGAGVYGSYDLTNKISDYGVSFYAGIGIGDETEGYGFFAAYTIGHLTGSSWNFGIGGYYNTKNRPKVYKSSVSDNYGNADGECAYRCLEECSESYGYSQYDFNYWYEQYEKYKNGMVNLAEGVDVNDLQGLINSSDVFASDRIGTIDQITKAIQNNKRIIVGVTIEKGSSHAVMVKKVKVWPSGRYMIYFAETSPQSQAPCCISHFSTDKYSFVTFYLH